MNYKNHDDVVSQLQEAGLVIDLPLKVARGAKSERCRIDGGDREKRGWYRLHEWTMDSGDVMLVGSYGVFSGDDAGTRKVELTKRCDACAREMSIKEKSCPGCGSKDVRRREMSDEQKAALREKQAQDKKRADAERAADVQRAAAWASAVWRKCREIEPGGHDYLVRKQLAGSGGARVLESNDGINLDGAEADDYKYLARFHGALVVPMCAPDGKVFGLQFILSRTAHKDLIARRDGRDKEYWPAGLGKDGMYHLIGTTPGRVCLEAEGFATALSIHNATGLTIAVAFDAGNLPKVAKVLHKTYRRTRILACGDDDWLQKCAEAECGKYTPVAEPLCRHCGKPHRKSNAGLQRAQEAAGDTGGWLLPKFAGDRPTDRKGPTDFNDLHVAEGLQVVRAQIEAALAAAKIAVVQPAPPSGAGDPAQGAGDRADLASLIDVDEACHRFALIYGAGGTLFDQHEHMLVPKSDVLDVLVDHGWREWKLRPDRQVVRLSEVGFDPSCTDPVIRCNLWGGWPTKPKRGACDVLLDVLRWMCSDEDKPDDVFDWIIKWLAFPIQNPGAKMKTALVLHGPQGVGKNMFFEAVMAIYGEYGRIVDQSAIEDKFNDWASKKLFLIADEVVARQELYHVKNKLKHLITGDWIRINPKNVAAHDEKNHVNLVFLSNEIQPLVLEKDDRRYTVIWTPHKLPPEFYGEVAAELANGGIAALHDHLLSVDLNGFYAHTNPPDTRAKRELIEQSMDSTERFWHHWTGGLLDGLPVVPCRSEDLFDVYRTWCNRVGIGRAASQHIVMGNYGKRRDCKKAISHYYNGATKKQSTFIFPAQCEMPPGLSKEAWLTDCHQKFTDGSATWKGGGQWKGGEA